MSNEPDENSPLWILAYGALIVGAIFGGMRLLETILERFKQGASLVPDDYIAPMLIAGGIASAGVALVYLLHWLCRPRRSEQIEME